LDQVERCLGELEEVIPTDAPQDHHIELLTIPGGGCAPPKVMGAETGADMSRLPSAVHLSSGVSLAPAVARMGRTHPPPGTSSGNK